MSAPAVPGPRPGIIIFKPKSSPSSSSSSSSSSSKGKDDGPMREETRQRKRAFDFLKVLSPSYDDHHHMIFFWSRSWSSWNHHHHHHHQVLLKFAFSQAGVILICIIYAVVGANIYLSMEVKSSSISLSSPLSSSKPQQKIVRFC